METKSSSVTDIEFSCMNSPLILVEVIIEIAIEKEIKCLLLFKNIY